MRQIKAYQNILMVLLALFSSSFFIRCNHTEDTRVKVIFDTDANNELDDQHALAYLLLNEETFNVLGVTVNSTYNGGAIQSHYDEAKRVIELCGKDTLIPLLLGAEADFNSIQKHINQSMFDGNKAVDFIIAEANKKSSKKLVVLAVGKLTNVALAILKDSTLEQKMKVVWLGSNYPDAGEYNLENDIPALNFVLNSKVEFEMAVCRYGKDSGTDAVKVTKEDISQNLKGKGVVVNPVKGRYGNLHKTFGDYSMSLFEHANYYGNPPSRSLFDMAAVAIVKDATWAKSKLISVPKYQNSQWIEQPENSRRIKVWEYFNKEEILKDFYATLSK